MIDSANATNLIQKQINDAYQKELTRWQNDPEHLADPETFETNHPRPDEEEFERRFLKTRNMTPEKFHARVNAMIDAAFGEEPTPDSKSGKKPDSGAGAATEPKVDESTADFEAHAPKRIRDVVHRIAKIAEKDPSDAGTQLAQAETRSEDDETSMSKEEVDATLSRLKEFMPAGPFRKLKAAYAAEILRGPRAEESTP
jgi:hypothetical protein